MKAWQDLSNHGKYELTTTSTGAINEKSVEIDSITYYFTPNEVNDDMAQILNLLVASGVDITTIGASENDYVFKNGSTYYKFDTSGISNSNIKIIEGNSADHTYNKVVDDGTIKYYKVVGTRESDVRGSDVFVGGYYEGQYNSETGHTAGGAIYTIDTVPLIEADFVSNRTAGFGGAMSLSASTPDADEGENAKVSLISGDFVDNKANKTGGAIYGGIIDTIVGNFNSNTAEWDGGAIASKVDKIYANFNSNIALDEGGAIYRGNSSQASIIEGDFINNRAKTGGAIYNKNGVFKNITGNFKYNTATQNGGAIYNLNGTFDNILWCYL